MNIEKFLEIINYNKSNMEIYNKLLHKYEVNKKLYLNYKDNIFTDHLGKELNKNQYRKIVIVFLIISIMENDIRFYNTALKIAENINFKITKINIDYWLLNEKKNTCS